MLLGFFIKKLKLIFTYFCYFWHSECAKIVPDCAKQSAEQIIKSRKAKNGYKNIQIFLAFFIFAQNICDLILPVSWAVVAERQ